MGDGESRWRKEGVQGENGRVIEGRGDRKETKGSGGSRKGETTEHKRARGGEEGREVGWKKDVGRVERRGERQKKGPEKERLSPA